MKILLKYEVFLHYIFVRALIVSKFIVGHVQTRHVLCFMFVAGFIFVFMIRVNLNLTIVGMVKPIETLDKNVTLEFSELGNSSSTFSDNVRIFPKQIKLFII